MYRLAYCRALGLAGMILRRDGNIYPGCRASVLRVLNPMVTPYPTGLCTNSHGQTSFCVLVSKDGVPGLRSQVLLEA